MTLLGAQSLAQHAGWVAALKAKRALRLLQCLVYKFQVASSHAARAQVHALSRELLVPCSSCCS